MTPGRTFPLVFTFPDTIVGEGFVAYVEITGRALLTEEDGETWLYGVQPGGVAGGGTNYTEACREFKNGYLSVLYDSAAESETFEAFSAQVREFFETVNEPNATAWESALEEVRKNSTSLPGFSSVPADSRPPAIKIVHLSQDKMRPTVNRFGDFSEAA